MSVESTHLAFIKLGALEEKEKNWSELKNKGQKIMTILALIWFREITNQGQVMCHVFCKFWKQHGRQEGACRSGRETLVRKSGSGPGDLLLVLLPCVWPWASHLISLGFSFPALLGTSWVRPEVFQTIASHTVPWCLLSSKLLLDVSLVVLLWSETWVWFRIKKLLVSLFLFISPACSGKLQGHSDGEG